MDKIILSQQVTFIIRLVTTVLYCYLLNAQNVTSLLLIGYKVKNILKWGLATMLIRCMHGPSLVFTPYHKDNIWLGLKYNAGKL